MIIEISPSNKKPVFIKKEGTSDGVYLRAGPNTRRANQEYIEELMRENKRKNYDEEAIHADPSILSNLLLKNIFNRIDKERLVTEKITCRSSANSDKFYPTVSGVLMFSEAPHLYIPEAIIQCTRFRGIDGRDIIQSEEIHGHLAKQAETSLELVKSWLIREYKLFSSQLKGKMLVPEVALREVITNSLIHRKYWIPGSIKIALYDNRLEIFNPGNFPGLIDLSHLGDGTTYLRNPTLARLARRFGLVEKLGTGIRIILESCQKAGIKRPEYIEGADNIKVIFSFLPAKDKFLSNEENLLALFNSRDEVTLGDVEKYLDVSRNTATRRLNQLIANGKIVRLGKGPAVKFILVKS